MTEHYFSRHQTSELVKREWAIQHKGKILRFETASGTFSPRKLDTGTTTLLDEMQLPASGRVLDLGCGNGIIGIAVAATNPALDVVLADINGRAIVETRSNIKRNHVKNAVVVQSDLFEKIEGEFDCVLTNPPISAGRAVVFAMVAGAHAHLNPGGSLQLVARGKKGGETIRDEMERVFGNAETLGRKSGFHVYKSVRR